jgi:hypothetical protein
VDLQQSIGNQALQRLIRSRYIQAKLKVNAPGDGFEQEADRVAERVMRMPESQTPRPQDAEEEEESIQTKSFSAQPAGFLVQRKCAECSSGGEPCPKCTEEESLQRKPLAGTIAPVIQRRQNESVEEEERLSLKQSSGPTPESTPTINENIGSLLGGGQPLPAATRSFFEPRFGVDFGGVRAHTHSGAAQIARSVNAKAFTLGQDLVFGEGQYSPETTDGKKLLAHELTHVIQQGGGTQTNQGGQKPTLQKSPDLKIMRAGFESSIQVCHRVLESRDFDVTKGGLRVVFVLEELDKNVVDCKDFPFWVTLTRSKDWWPDDEISTCQAVTGTTSTFTFANLSPATYYLTIWRNFHHPYCCLKGEISVYDEPVSGNSSECELDTDPTVMEVVHGALDIAGFIPVLGAIPDGINAVIYVAEGDWTNAGLSAVAMVPLFGDGAKVVVKGGKEVIEVSGKTAVKMGKQELSERLAKAAAEKAKKEAAEKAAKEAAEKAAKEKAGKETAEEAGEKSKPEKKKGGGKWTCYGRSAVLQIPSALPEHKCPLDGTYVDGPPVSGPTEAAACLAAKHAFNAMMPRGCRPKHLDCRCTKTR